MQLNTIESFFKLTGIPSQTAALNCALRLGVVDALIEGSKTPSELAAGCGLNERGVEALLVVLADTGLVERFGDDYALSQAARMIPGSLWGAMFQHWTRLEKALRDRPTSASSTNGSDQSVPPAKEFIDYLAQGEWASTGIALKVAEALGIGSERQNLRVLDIGCSAAIYSMTIAHRDPQATVTLVDDQAGLARAQTTVNSLEVGSRVRYVETDDLQVDFGGPEFDLVLIADRINLLSEKQAQQQFRQAGESLVSGGELAVVDVFPGQPRGEVALGVHQLQQLIGTGHGSWTTEQLKSWIEETGFRDIQFTHLPAPPYTRGLLLAALA